MGQNLTGQWDFNTGDLKATVGTDLSYADAVTQQATSFGTTTALGIPTINGTDANVMKFPAATNTMGFLMYSPSTANGGGSLVNEWSLVMDVLYPSASAGINRPIIDSDGNANVAGPEFIVSSSDGVGSPPSGPYLGHIAPNTWYRLGITVSNSKIVVYLNGSSVGTLPGYAADGRFSLSPSFQTLIFGNNLAPEAAIGYLNSLQLWDAALNAGQMSALGGPSAAGMPTNLPPVASFVESQSPGINEINVLPTPTIDVVLNQGNSTITPSSIKLDMDGSVLPATLNSTPPTFELTYTNTTLLEPGSIHTLTVSWTESVAGAKSSSWQFTTYNYQKLTLPQAFYLETFDELSEITDAPGPLPPGWTVSNLTSDGTAGYDLANRDSDSYKDWVLVSSNRFSTWGANRTTIPPIVVNGQLLSSLAYGNLMWEETDQRCGGCQGQYQEMYTGDINCTGRSNVFVSWYSIYMQNQDNMNCAEYSIDKGQTWLPVRYMFCTAGNGENSDIYYTNDASGKPVIDVGATFSTPDPNRNFSLADPVASTNYGSYIKAPISTNLIPYIIGYTNDAVDRGQFPYNGMEVVVVRIPQADNQATVRFRFLGTGTSAWYWGIDNVGLYEINTPNISTQPANQTVSAGANASFTVAAQSSTPLTYHWLHTGTNLVDNGHFSGVTNATLNISGVTTNDAGNYLCVVGNSSGNVQSSPALLTVIVVPQITTQPQSIVTSAGLPVTLSGAAIGQAPLTYTWLKNGTASGQTGSSISFASIQASDGGSYQLAVSNSAGGAVSAIARVIVAPSVFSSNLVVHITFDGNYNDTSGRGNNATPVGSPTLVAGKLGQAMKFTTTQDGSTKDYATLSYPADLKFGSDVDFSMSFWVNYTQQVDDPPFISNKDWGSSGNPGWGIFSQDSGHYRANVTGTAGTKYDVSGSTPLIRDGNWHNIVLSYARGAIVSLYTDGAVSANSPDLTTGSVDTDALGFNVNIGQDGKGTYTDGGSAGITNALIDDVGLWRRALSPQEAASIYTSGQAGKDLSQVVVSTGPSKVTLSASISGSNLVLTWTGAPTVSLQSSTSISPASWQTVPNTLGANSAQVPITGGASFFRLVSQ
jgi:hypothetical protein